MPKRGFLLAFAMIMGLGIQAQSLTDASVPAKARQAMKANVPSAHPAWSSGPDNTYEAKFDANGQSMVYVFDANGLLNEKKQLCKIGGLPESVSASIASTYPGVEHQAAYKVITRQRQRYFEVVVPGRGTLDYMRFDVAGVPVGKSSLALAEQPVPAPVASARPAYMDDELDMSKSEPIRTSQEPVKPVMAMRGESTTTVNTEVDLSDDIDIEAEMLDEDLGDLLDDEDDIDLDELLNDDDDWEDIDILDEEEDDWEDIDPLYED